MGEHAGSEGISRRGFVKGVAVGGAGLVGMGMLGGCATKSTAGVTGVPDAWTYEADVIVLGFGSAGGTAAYQAAKQGASVIILEKMNEKLSGGHSSCFGGGFFPANAKEYYFNGGAGTMTEAEAAALSANNDEAYKWMKGTGKLKFAADGYSVVGGAPAWYEAFRSVVLENSAIKVMYETPAVSLIQDPVTKEIKGVNATQGGNAITVKGKKAVIICTSDYVENHDLVEALHYRQLPYANMGAPSATGEGGMMALAAGAKLAHANNTCWEWASFALRKASEEMKTGIIYTQATLAEIMTMTEGSSGVESKIFVNAYGKRFMDETTSLNHQKTSTALRFLDQTLPLMGANKDYDNLPAWLVMDSTCFNAAPLGKSKGLSAPSKWAECKGIYTWSDDNKAELTKGWILQADTIEALAAKMSSKFYMSGKAVTVPAAALKQTVADYNASCASAPQPDSFGRKNRQALAKGPFYAVELLSCGVYALGFLHPDEKSRVIDVNDKPMLRLYCGGNVGQGTELVPIGVGGCMARGMMAAKDAVTLTAWDAVAK